MHAADEILELARDGNGDIFLIEKTSGETAMVLRRTGANGYTLYNNTVAGAKIIQDSSMKDVAGGIVGIDAQKTIAGGVISSFNWLHMYLASYTFTETKGGTGNIISNIVNGTLQATTPANNDSAKTVQIDSIALTLLPRILLFRVSAIAIPNPGQATTMEFGVVDAAGTHYAKITTANGGTNWFFKTAAGGAATSVAAVQPAVGDVYVFYLSSARAVVFKNNAGVYSSATNIPTAAVAPFVNIATGVGIGAGMQVTFDFLRA